MAPVVLRIGLKVTRPIETGSSAPALAILLGARNIRENVAMHLPALLTQRM